MLSSGFGRGAGVWAPKAKGNLRNPLVAYFIGIAASRFGIGLGQPLQRLTCHLAPSVAGHHMTVLPSLLLLDRGGRRPRLRRIPG